MPKRINTTMNEVTMRQSVTANAMRRSLNVSGARERQTEPGQTEADDIVTPRFLRKTMTDAFN